MSGRERFSYRDYEIKRAIGMDAWHVFDTRKPWPNGFVWTFYGDLSRDEVRGKIREKESESNNLSDTDTEEDDRDV